MLDEYSTRSSEATIDIIADNKLKSDGDLYLHVHYIENDIENDCKSIERINDEFNKDLNNFITTINPVHNNNDNNLHSDGLNINLNSDPKINAICYLCTLLLFLLLWIIFIILY